MLRELHIQNLAIIEKVVIELGPGLNVFTGQTGAGKSLVLGALELLLALRGGGEEAATFVRPGCGEARVSGLFEIDGADRLGRLGEIFDQSLRGDEPILITRRLSASGRSSVSVNGLPATASMLREAGQLLVDIHGQHDQQFLLKPANQVLILDAFAGATGERLAFGATLRELREARGRLAELRESQSRRLESLELYRFQLDEIDRAGLHAGEYEQTKARYSVLKNAAHLQAGSAQVLSALSEGEDTVLERLAGLSRLVQELLRMDAGLGEVAQRFDQADELLNEAARELASYQDRLDVDGGELAAVEERLDVLNRLIHKYARLAPPADDAVAGVLAYREEVAAKVAGLEADAQTADELELRIAESRQRLAETGKRLGRLRRQASRRLKALVEQQFGDLEMHEAAFEVRLRGLDVDDPAVDSLGLDEMEFLVRTNPGQEMLPLRKIASGGEMSRIMLALKTILADKDQVSVLVFDEIDSNIGDRLGATIGRKMRELARGPDGAERTGHQVLCITHLSQIAACADRHLQISKRVIGAEDDRQTQACVRKVEGEGRIRELAEMMAGTKVSPATLEHARTLLEQAAAPPRPSARRRAPAGLVT